MDGVSASLSGIRTTALSVAAASNNVANVNTADFKAKRVDTEDLAEGGVRASQVVASQEPASANGSNVDLATEAVNLKTDKVTYEANLQFLQVQSAMLGAVMDMKA